MAKGILEFFLPEEMEEFQTAVDGSKYKAVLHEVGQRVFRPARKHGYSGMSDKIQSLINKGDEMEIEVDGHSYGLATELIAQLEKLFYQVIEEKGVEI